MKERKIPASSKKWGTCCCCFGMWKKGNSVGDHHFALFCLTTWNLYQDVWPTIATQISQSHQKGDNLVLYDSYVFPIGHRHGSIPAWCGGSCFGCVASGLEFSFMLHSRVLSERLSEEFSYSFSLLELNPMSRSIIQQQNIGRPTLHALNWRVMILLC